MNREVMTAHVAALEQNLIEILIAVQEAFDADPPEYPKARLLKEQAAQSASIALCLRGMTDRTPADGPTLWREIDALGGAEEMPDDYNDAVRAVLAILERRGFTEERDAK